MVGYMVHKRIYTCTICYTREFTLVQYVTQENLHMYNTFLTLESKLYKALTIFYFTDNTWHVIKTYT